MSRPDAFVLPEAEDQVHEVSNVVYLVSANGGAFTGGLGCSQGPADEADGAGGSGTNAPVAAVVWLCCCLVQYLKPIVSVAGKKWKAPGCVLFLGVVVQMLIVTDPGTSDLLDIVFRSP